MTAVQYRSVNELILPHQDLTVANPRAIFRGVISNYSPASEFLGYKEMLLSLTWMFLEVSNKK